MMAPGGAYAEYAVAPAHTVFQIPEGVTFEGTYLAAFANWRFLIGVLFDVFHFWL